MKAGWLPKNEVKAVVARIAIVTAGGARLKNRESAMEGVAPESACRPSAKVSATLVGKVGSIAALSKVDVEYVFFLQMSLNFCGRQTLPQWATRPQNTWKMDKSHLLARRDRGVLFKI